MLSNCSTTLTLMVKTMKYKRDVHYSASFRRDYKKAKKQGKDIALLRDVIGRLANDEILVEKHLTMPYRVTGEATGNAMSHPIGC